GRGAAPPSKTSMSFLPYKTARGANPIRGFSLDVPKLGGYSTRHHTFFGRATSRPRTFAGVPMGSYAATWCADATNVVKESNERNNCGSPGNDLELLYLAKRTWSGSLSGSGPVSGDVQERWTSTD